MSGLPPYPSGDLNAWALQMVEYLMARERIDAAVTPTAVGLAYLSDEDKALHDGILMYDPADTASVVVSKGGTWRPIADYLPNGTPTVGDGIVWDGDEWISANVWVVAGYGGIRQSTPVALSDLGAGWTVLTADSTAVTTPRGLSQLPLTNAISFNTKGVWQVTVGFSLTHNELNSARNFEIRLFNLTDGVGGTGTSIGVGRNTDTTTVSLTFLLEVGDDQLTDGYQIQVGNGSTVTGVTENNYTLIASLVSEYRG